MSYILEIIRAKVYDFESVVPVSGLCYIVQSVYFLVFFFYLPKCIYLFIFLLLSKLVVNICIMDTFFVKSFTKIYK